MDSTGSPEHDAAIDEKEPWVVSALVVGTILLTAVDVVQWRRGQRPVGLDSKEKTDIEANA